MKKPRKLRAAPVKPQGSSQTVIVALLVVIAVGVGYLALKPEPTTWDRLDADIEAMGDIPAKYRGREYR